MHWRSRASLDSRPTRSSRGKTRPGSWRGREEAVERASEDELPEAAGPLARSGEDVSEDLAVGSERV